jgi:hypothetical protein
MSNTVLSLNHRLKDLGLGSSLMLSLGLGLSISSAVSERLIWDFDNERILKINNSQY